MSTSRASRPSMMADIPNKWLWCDDNAKVTKWHMNLPNRPRYSIFVSSFINTANRAWEKAINPSTTLSPLDRDMIQCLLEDPISAETMIKTLTAYNNFIGGGKAELKQYGLITWFDEDPNDAAVERGSDTLYKLIERTLPKYHEVEAVRAASKGKGKNKRRNKGKGKGKATTDNQADEDEDEEMEDAPMEDEQTMTSLNDMEVELTNAGNTPAASTDKGKGKLQIPVQFGELPYVGSKNKRDSQGKKDDGNDEEWKKFFLE